MSRLPCLLLVFTMSACYSYEYDPGVQIPDMETDMEAQPPVVTITLPEQDAEVVNDVRLVAVAVDNEGENISSELVWVKDGSPFAIGGDVTVTLDLGPQTVTAQVSDSLGVIGQSQVTFVVVDSE